MSINDQENQKSSIINNHLKSLFAIEDDDVFLHHQKYFEKIQRKYWENLTPINDNKPTNKRGDNV